MTFERVAVPVDQTLVLHDRARDVAPVAQQAGEFQPGGDMGLVQAKDVAELDHRPVDLARCDQIQPASVMRLGAILGAVAGGEADRRHEQKDRTERTSAAGHRKLQSEGGRTASYRRPNPEVGRLAAASRHPIPKPEAAKPG